MRRFMRRNKARMLADALIVVSIYAVCLYRNKRTFDKFLSEHDLLHEFYTPE